MAVFLLLPYKYITYNETYIEFLLLDKIPLCTGQKQGLG